MKAYRAQRLAGPRALVLEETDTPAPGARELAIAVSAVGLTLADLAAVSGERLPHPNLPFTPGLEVAGTVAALGAELQEPRLGSRVVAFLPWGGLAERVVVSSEVCVEVPQSVTLARSVALPLAYGGALLALETKACLRSGQSVLVLGAGGHAGLAAIAIAKMLGAVVIGVANGDKRLARAREHGADHVLDAGLVSLAAAVGELTGGRGADIVYDPVGGDAAAAALGALAPGGRILLAGFASGRPPSLDFAQLFARGGELLTANMILEMERRPLSMREALARVIAWTEEKKLEPRIAAQFPFAGILPAFDYIAARRGSGAVVIKLSDTDE
jgi:NADPH2:quinone reductase